MGDVLLCGEALTRPGGSGNRIKAVCLQSGICGIAEIIAGGATGVLQMNEVLFLASE